MLRAGLIVLLGILPACAGVPGPRFSQTVAASFARQPMRKLTTPELEVYYPQSAEAAAHAIAARAADCLTRLRAKTAVQRPRERALLYLTDANFNNAYVSGQNAGEPLHSVLPLYATNEGFHFDALGTASIGDVGCHELLHYVHYEQVEGFWRLVNAAFGPSVAPQAFLERWFTEGLAQYYEGRLGADTGRPHSPLYRAEFEAGIWGRGGWIGAGDLSLAQREIIPASGAYLVGLHFIEYLAEKYGEEKLWDVVDRQAHAFWVPFGVALRFKAVYGQSLGALIDEWSDARQQFGPQPPLARRWPLVKDVGYAARLAVGPDGTIAVVSAGRDEVAKLKLFEPDGTLRAEEKLARFVPPRAWVGAGPGSVSGLSFTADGRWLYLMNEGASELGDDRAQLWKVNARTAEIDRVWDDVGGLGGSLHPAGAQYTFVDVTPGQAKLVGFDLATRERTTLFTPPAGVSIGAPAWSPDGKRLAYSQLGPRGWDLWLREADGTTRALTSDGAFNYGARWVDDGAIVFMRTAGGAAQPHRIALDAGAIVQLTSTDHAAFDPAMLPDGKVVFLDRLGWNWTVTAAPVDAPQPVVPQAPAELPPPPPPAVVESDEPYRPFEGIGTPLLRMPALASFSPSCDDVRCRLDATFALALAGRDRLSFHNWGLTAVVSTPSLDLSITGSYANMTQAPWYVGTSVSYDRQTTADPLIGPYLRETIAANVAAGRSFWDTPVGLSLGGFQLWDRAQDNPHFFGPSVGVDYFAGEGTVYGGLTRALGARGQLSIYPSGLSSYTVTDLEFGFTTALPLPVLKRHSLLLTLDGRALFGAPEGALQVGGQPRGNDLFTLGRSNDGGEGGPDVPVPEPFAIGVRGYEDFGVRATRAGVALARYRYPFVFDRGFASILWVLPSIFFRQADVDLFGTAALTDNAVHPWLRAAGAAVSFRMLLGGAVPLSLYYRFSYRFDEGLQPLHAFGFAFE